MTVQLPWLKSIFTLNVLTSSRRNWYATWASLSLSKVTYHALLMADSQEEIGGQFLPLNRFYEEREGTKLLDVNTTEVKGYKPQFPPEWCSPCPAISRCSGCDSAGL